MSLQDVIYEKIKAEITNDPNGIGYAGKTDDEIKSLLNNAEIRTRQVQDTLPSPLNRILSGIGGVGNVISTQDVASAKVTADVVIP